MKLLSLLLPLFIATLAVFGQPEDKAGKKPHPPNPGSGSRAKLDEVTSRVTAGMAGPEHSPPVRRNNYIDDFIFDKLERDGIPHAPLSSDAEFLRRAHLDLTGRLPEPQRIEKWSLTSLQQRLVKTGGRLLKHTRYYWPLLAEGPLTRRLFVTMLGVCAAESGRGFKVD